MKPDTLDQLTSKSKFVAVFISTAIIGVMLISIAVYRASEEMEIINEVDKIYGMTTGFVDGEIATSYEKLNDLAKTLATDEYQIFVSSRDTGIVPALAGQSLAHYMNIGNLEHSRINRRGGYINDQGKIITWARIPYGEFSVIVAHEFSTNIAEALAYVYPKRLLIPIAFYIWMTVWATLTLGYLLDRLRSQKMIMEYMALHDALTQLPNRNLLNDRLTNLIRLSKRQNSTFSLAIVDVDEFKQINDSMGHETGDALLKQISTRLKSTLREHDTVARLGGDEFTILMPNVDERSYMNFFGRIKDTLDKSYDLGGKRLHVKCSIGVAVYPHHGCNADELMRSADQAMYKAKSEGGTIHIHEKERTIPPLPENNICPNIA